MPEIGIILDKDPAWPDLAEKTRRGKVIHLTNKFDVTALRGGMASGLASVAFRFDLPDGRSVIVETSLRSLYSATMALAARYGEEFMTGGKPAEQEMKLGFALAELMKQIQEAKRRLGEPATIDLSAADEAWADWKRQHAEGEDAR